MRSFIRRRWGLVLLLGAPALIALVVLLWLGDELGQRTADEAGYRQIKNGMNENEVAALLGKPYSVVGFLPPLAGPKWEHWLRDDYQIAVYFGTEGQVEQKSFKEHGQQTLWQKAIGRFRRSFRRLGW
jgi:hypothetical protein